MSRTRLAAGLLVLFATVTGLAGAWLMVLNWPLPLSVPEWGFPGFQGVGAVVFTAVGLPVALRRPDNPVGWLALVAGALTGLQFAGHQYSIYGLLAAPGSVPVPSLGAWIEEWIWIPILGGWGIFTFLLFPTGHLASPRWRVVAWLAAVSIVLGMIGGALSPPIRVPGAVHPFVPGHPPALAAPLLGVGAGVLLAALVASVGSLVVRFLGSVGPERQQIKWLALAGVIVGGAVVAYGVTSLFLADPHNPGAAALALSVLAVPLAIAVAMLRYGLYEVDRLFNRTLVYGAVSIVLVALYAGSVLVLQASLTPITGGDTLAVAASTLLVAAAFQPVRRRMQREVDRRFFRSRYDAQRSAERLGARLREEVDLDMLGRALVGEVTQAVRPAAVSIWLRRR